MKKLTAFLLVCLLISGSILVGGIKEAAAAYPEKPITAYVAWSAGGGADLVFRALATVFQKYSGGQPLIVKNVPGSAGVIGINEYMNVKPDGYSILHWNSAHVIKTHMNEVPFTATEFQPVIKLVENNTYILVRADSPFKDLKELVSYAKENPGQLTLGNAGIGGGSHFAAISFVTAAGIEVTQVPFQGGGPAALGVLNGQVDCGMNIPPEGLTNIEAGQLRVLGVMANERFPQFPDVPTVREQGVDTSYSQWRGVVVHKAVPKEIVQRIHDIFKQCLEDEEFKQKMAEMSVTIAYANGEDYGKEIEQDDKNYEQIIKANKLGDRYK